MSKQDLFVEEFLSLLDDLLPKFLCREEYTSFKVVPKREKILRYLLELYNGYLKLDLHII